MKATGTARTHLLENAGVRAQLGAECCQHADHGAAAVDDLRRQTRERHGLCADTVSMCDASQT